MSPEGRKSLVSGNEDLIEMENQMKLRGFSRKTIKSYLFYASKFIGSGKDPEEFILEMIERGKGKETVRVAGFSIKFFLRCCSNREGINMKITELPNVKRRKRLPDVLSTNEIKEMIKVTENPKHRLVLQILYSCGLRLGELIKLKWEDIDFSRNMIHVKSGKGDKDRIVMLSGKVKRSLREFSETKEGILFKSIRGKKYSPKTVQMIVGSSAKKAGISKKVTPHILRHSFATHLLENGTDIRYIKELLGHSNIETTLIYTKVSNRDISRIKSPLDDL